MCKRTCSHTYLVHHGDQAHYYLILELVTGGDLLHRIQKKVFTYLCSIQHDCGCVRVSKSCAAMISPHNHHHHRARTVRKDLRKTSPAKLCGRCLPPSSTATNTKSYIETSRWCACCYTHAYACMCSSKHICMRTGSL